MHKLVSVASRIALACGVSGALMAPATAADLGGYQNYPDKGRGQGIYVPSFFSWSGPYIGGHVGYSGGTTTTRALDAGAFDGDLVKVETLPYGWMGGAQAGYNWQSEAFVFGLEGDLGYIGAEDGKTGPTGFAKVDYGWYGTAAARIGFSDSRWLFYGKGGLALANITNKAGAVNSGAIDSGDYTSLDDIRVGWTAGGGVEFAFQRDWSMKIEYLYMDFGTDKSSNFDGDRFSHDNSLHTVKVGLNYRLHQPGEPLK